VLHLHRADRADGLIGALAELLATPIADPFAPEVVGVPTHGVERWLTQQLSGRLGAAGGRADGVCANVVFPSPRQLVDGVVAAGSGIEAEADPWLPQRAVWPLLQVVDESLDEPWLRQLATHLDQGQGDRSRRLRFAQHLAGLYDRYALHRPQMLEAWLVGRDDGGAGGMLAADQRWQAALWRRLRERIAVPGPAERLEAACARVVADPGLVALPSRLSLFGLTSLPARHLQVLQALADGREVHLLLLQPSDASWRRTAGAVYRDGPVGLRAGVSTSLLPDHPLLASWGRDARELQLVLERVGDTAAAGHRPVDHPADTLLARVQADVRADRAPAPPAVGDDRPLLDDGDVSLQVHACHGPGRQVEVLRDAILHALDEDPSLEPRDIIVMCPDIETFAPLIQATFGAGETEEPIPGDRPAGVHPPGLRVRLADRALRETNPVLAIVARLLELATARVTASDVLDLADRQPVRRRFRFGQDDIARLEEWVASSGIRWGFDAEHRAPFRMDKVAQGTWHAGLDRLLTGVAMAEDEPRLLGGVLPLDDVDSSAIDLAGRFAELVDRLQHVLAGMGAAQPIDAWVAAIAEAADTLTSAAPRDEWQRSELQRLLADVQDEATVDGTVATALLDAADLAALLEGRLAGRPTRASFRTGHLTVCTLQPMRSVPHRVVCLLGLDDTVFPRRAPRDGDDLLLDDPHVGDRDPRSEDRQILLDALLAATDRLVITYTGNDERTNAPRSPAVPVGELLDTVDRTVRCVGEGAPRDRIVIRHPLQPFDPRNFEQGGIVPRRIWSFDAVTLAGARALTAERAPRAPFLRGPLPAVERPVIEIDDLVAFLGHPVREFLAQRLGVGAGVRTDEVQDALAVALDPLASWEIGRRLLEARLAGADATDALAAERARGALPPGEIGTDVLRSIEPVVEAVLTSAAAALDLHAERRSADLRVALGDGRMLGGTVSGLAGDVVQVVTYARVSARQRLGAWVRLLALTAAHPERSFSAVTVGRARRSAVASQATVTVARVPPLDGDAAARRAQSLAHLRVLVDLYDRGMREPLPLFCETSAAYAAGGPAAEARARGAWTSDFRRPREDRDAEHELVLGRERPFDDLLAEPPRADEAGDGWSADEATRFGRYAHRLWDGLLPTEGVADR
jgi:exodeoxyribonuclease V gamma subunit